MFECFHSFTLCFPEKPSNLICLKSFPICCFHFLNVFSLFSFQCAGRECKALSKLNNNQVNWSPCLTRITSRPQSRVGLLRKEVIQPLVLERLPCYDFTPIIEPTFGRALLAVRLRTSGVPDSHGVTGGVYKARERIHRGMLIRDY